MSEQEQNGAEARQAGGLEVTRREFAALSGLALLGSLLPNVGSLGAQISNSRGMQARLVDQHVERLSDGGTRTTTVIEYESPAGLANLQGYPSKGYRSRQTCIEVKRPTSTGEVVEYDISFDPPVPTAVGTRGRRVRMRGEVTHGHVRPDGTRVDTMVVTGSGDTVDVGGPTTLQLERPDKLPDSVTKLTPAQRLQRAVDLINQNGGMMPHADLPGGMRVVDVVAESRE